MLNQYASETSSRALGKVSEPVKAASPLQGEINALKNSLESHNKYVLSLREKLKPVWLDVPRDEKKPCDPPCAGLSEMPTQVRDCRLMLDRIDEVIQFLLERVEV